MDKRLKEISFDHADEDEVMAATEGLAGKTDLIVSKLEKLNTLMKKLEEVCSTK